MCWQYLVSLLVKQVAVMPGSEDDFGSGGVVNAHLLRTLEATGNVTSLEAHVTAAVTYVRKDIWKVVKFADNATWNFDGRVSRLIMERLGMTEEEWKVVYPKIKKQCKAALQSKRNSVTQQIKNEVKKGKFG